MILRAINASLWQAVESSGTDHSIGNGIFLKIDDKEHLKSEQKMQFKMQNIKVDPEKQNTNQ